MASLRKSRNYNEHKVVTILGPSTIVHGDLQCQGTIRIEGFVGGNVTSDDSVVLLESGRVTGNITAGRVIVSGEVTGNVTAAERLDISAKGKIIGDITAPRISIQEGVLFEGKCVMKPVVA